ncbi:MAG: helix-turn-helix domain-containing protein [Spirochaetales bacterium]|nr:helix-turn-helix domain-containing protein [Spirochaetales bacterium]
MSSVDYEYLARSMCRFSGVPVRVYEGNSRLFSFFPADIPKDPVVLCLDEIMSMPGHVGYHATPLFHYYGVLNVGAFRIVVGPTSRIMADEQALRKLAFDIDVPQNEVQAFIDGMNAIQRLSVEALVQMMCTVNHLLNDGEKLELADVAIHEELQQSIRSDVEKERTVRRYEDDRPENTAHNTLALEETLMDIVRNGDTVALKRWASAAPPVQGGRIAGDQLRQMRNTFIVTATLASRAAIRGGMREDDAFTLSDSYIQKAEHLTSFGGIINLQFHMLLDFTEHVERLHVGKHTTKLSLDVANYVRHHLSEPVRVEDLAEELFISRPYLSAKFRKETGQSLTDFILGEKTEEAKRLLRYSDKTSSAIAAYLGFSSQGHFCRVFRTYAGMTPNEYREKHRR